jgi:hypothetical protein
VLFSCITSQALCLDQSSIIIWLFTILRQVASFTPRSLQPVERTSPWRPWSKKKKICCPYRKSNSGNSMQSQSLYRLTYSGFISNSLVQWNLRFSKAVAIHFIKQDPFLWTTLEHCSSWMSVHWCAPRDGQNRIFQKANTCTVGVYYPTQKHTTFS